MVGRNSAITTSFSIKPAKTTFVYFDTASLVVRALHFNSRMVQQRLLCATMPPSNEQKTQLQRMADCTRIALQRAFAVGKVHSPQS